MVKRAVSCAPVIRAVRSVCRSLSTLGSAALPNPVEQLESRVLMSAALPAGVVNVRWHGQMVTAYQNQYVTEVKNPQRFAAVTAKLGLTGVDSLGGGNLYQFDTTLPVTKVEKFVERYPNAFSIIQPNGYQKAQSVLPNDPGYGNEWGSNNVGQVEPFDYNRDGVVTPYNSVNNPTPPTTITYPSPPYPNENQVGVVGDDIDARDAWSITTGSPDVVVAVLDTGLDINHPDIIPNLWTNPLDTAANNFNGDGYAGDIHGYNFVANNADVTDENGHGTNVAGIIGAAGNNGIGVSGVAWNVKLLPVKALDASGAGTDSSIINGLNYLITLKHLGINIVAVNESLGGPEFPINILENKVVGRLNQAGILDVVAAGNSTTNLDRGQGSPGKQSLNDPNVITVAAVDNQFKLATFSSFGANSVDLAAPGIDIYSTSPTYAVTLNDEVAEESDIPQFGENYGYLTGTSQATPTVAGIIALEAAANPRATPAQLKQALLDGVTYDPYLASQNGLPAKVLTSGVANAYKAVENVLNQYQSTDTTRGGSWRGFYGSQGASVVGDTATLPTFVTVTQTGGTPVVLDAVTRNPAAPQRVSDPAGRISAYQSSPTTESIGLNFTDGQSHQTELYVADLDRKRRVENVQLLDTATGQVLSTRTVSTFNKGTYLVYDLTGSVTLQVTNVSGPGAVYSGIFFDPAPTQPAVYLGSDAVTKGSNWRSLYGSQGAVVVGNNSSYPSYVASVNVTGQTTAVLKATTKNVYALQKEDDVNSNIQAYWAAADHMDIAVDFNDAVSHVVTLYVADYNNKHRTERIEAINAGTGASLYSQDISGFKTGQFVSFNVTGSTIFRVTRTGGPDAVVSGLFFDAPFGSKASFAGTDTTTRGNWRVGQYGNTAAFVVGDSFPVIDNPLNSSITTVGAIRQVFADPSSDLTALTKTGPTSLNVRVAAYLYSSTSMTLDYSNTDPVQHQLAFYFADYDNLKRTESITITDPATGQVLTSNIVNNFRRGKYLIYNVAGPVLITINASTGGNAVLSGVFVD